MIDVMVKMTKFRKYLE